jgi:agmatinase
MDETVTALGFLGLAEAGIGDSIVRPDVAILPVPYELTTSYGQGTANGPAACIAASAQVELYDSLLPEDLPCGFFIKTHAAWDGEGGTLAAQQDGIVDYLSPHLNKLFAKHSTDSPTGDLVTPFPLILGGEHGILPAVMRALSGFTGKDKTGLEKSGVEESGVQKSGLGESGLEDLTLVQVDAHADLRDELNGDTMSHACAARRALDAGVGRLIQVGVRAYCREEKDFALNDSRVETHFAHELLAPCTGEAAWANLLSTLQAIDGPVWLTFDIDGLDGSLVPTTGTPVPGGLTWWHAVSLIETLFAIPAADILGADIVEIVPSKEGNLTEFTAAMLATKIIAAHLAHRLTLGQKSSSSEQTNLQIESHESVCEHPIGSHVMLDYTGWKSPHGAAESWLIKIMSEAAASAGARIVHSHAEPFDGTISPTGFAAVVLIDESHISAHCYEEKGLLAIDCFTCGEVSAAAVADRIHAELNAVVPTLNLVERHTVERFISGKKSEKNSGKNPEKNSEKNNSIVP